MRRTSLNSIILGALAAAGAAACSTTYVVASPPLATHTPSAPAGGMIVPPGDLVPHVASERRIAVMPVLFVPQGVRLDDRVRVDRLLAQHVELAREHYRELLGTTFDVVAGPAAIYQAKYPDAHYLDVAADTPDDRAHRVVAELLEWSGTDRYSSDVVFLTVYVSSGRPIWAGARTFNGAPGSGGGYAELDITSLLADQGYRFQSTLVHELGHAFGLNHVTCHGQDLESSPSIMGGNPAHWSQGLTRSATPGDFIPEDRYMLAAASPVFPGLTYDAARYGANIDPERVQACFQRPMSETIGPLRAQPGVGFELYYNGQHVNGPDASLYTRAQAESSCTEARKLEPGVSVGCRYNGQLM